MKMVSVSRLFVVLLVLSSCVAISHDKKASNKNAPSRSGKKSAKLSKVIDDSLQDKVPNNEASKEDTGVSNKEVPGKLERDMLRLPDELMEKAIKGFESVAVLFLPLAIATNESLEHGDKIREQVFGKSFEVGEDICNDIYELYENLEGLRMAKIICDRLKEKFGDIPIMRQLEICYIRKVDAQIVLLEEELAYMIDKYNAGKPVEIKSKRAKFCGGKKKRKQGSKDHSVSSKSARTESSKLVA